MKKTVLFLFSILIVANTFAATWYVKLDETAWADKSSTHVKTNFSDAFSAAAANDEIWISAGVMKISETTAFNKHLKVYGGFVGNENAVSERAKVADGKPWEYVNITYVEQEEGKQVGFMSVPSGQNVLIDGLFFRNFTTPTNASVCNIRQNTRIENCVFAENTIKNTNGGAVAYYPGGHVKDSYFYKNTATAVGAGIFINQLNQPATIIGCTFEENEGQWGVAINAKPSNGHAPEIQTIITNNIVINNKGLSATPSIVAIRNEAAIVSNTLIANNDGLALHLASGEFVNGTIVNNRTTYAARVQSSDGVITSGSKTKLYNTVLWNNKNAADNAVGIHVFDATSDAEIANNASDEATTGLSETSTEANFILLEADNTGDDIDKNYAGFASPYASIGVTDTDQAALRDANWQTTQGSALVDAGSDVFVPGNAEFDLLGNDRFKDNVDIGAYENDKSLFSSVKNPETLASSCYYANGTLYLKNLQSDTKVSILSVSGQVLSTQSAKDMITIALPKGVYIVQTGMANHKILVQ